MYLVDTNVISELTRSRPNRHAVEWLHRQTAVIISVITIEELAFGVARAPAARRAALARWLDGVVESAALRLDVTEPIARAAADLRAAREAAGRPVTQADMLIGATALLHGLALATRNVRDFAGCGIRVVDPFVR